jgi:multiple antibiotic resistance protein
MSSAYISLFLTSFITLFVVIDPPGCGPIFAGLTRDAAPDHRPGMAYRATGVAAGILLAFAIFGEDLLRVLGVSLDAFRIAGGVMLFLIALEMVFERAQHRKEDSAEEKRTLVAEDISVFPMGIPMIAGPGAIATTMLLMSKSHGLINHLLVISAVLAVLSLTLVAMLAAVPIMRVLGPKLEAMITRVLGVLLAALAVQFIIDGIRASFA